ncbi:LANO_0F09956g1_1 [Lachancea nothofagi CBS 11611]|uniref:LANO_0F09956g1_1 n=1 Tax=Lachancea nothofagi CBS 11611 TaxID=1266666 RepID=A0A1G4KA85_9SACH|nr:LANO_0F09956g1_1 [Lachancea nothofagi CBS 11611]
MVKNFDVAFYTPISCSNRSSKFCQLDNGLLVLLISDPADTSAACSLTVASGSHNNPDEIPGLAHLCEHVILSSGSRKSPQTHDYHETIAENGGSQNAYTTGEDTTFCFELPGASDLGELVFEKALELFASSFKNPVFSDSIINKEIYAIESEHNVNKASTKKQLYHAMRLLAHRRHPFGRFCTGNFNTLCNFPSLHKVNLKHALSIYFKTYYRSPNMTMCIKGSQSLNALTKLAVKFFGDIPAEGELISRPSLRHLSSSKLKITHSSENSSLSNFKIAKLEWLPKYRNSDAFSSSLSRNIIAINSSKNPVLRLIFPINHKFTRLSTTSLLSLSNIWCDFFGEESIGSLAHCLKQQELVTGIVSSVSQFCTGEDGLTLELSLTQNGWRNTERILGILFDRYIPNFIHDQTEDIARYLSDLNAIDLLKFLYESTEISPMEICAEYSARMLLDMDALNPKCLLKGSPLLECNQENFSIGDFSESLESQTWWIGQAIKLQNFISEFVNRQNLRIAMLGDRSSSSLLNSTVSFPRSDPDYEFDYFEASIDMFSVQTAAESLPDYEFRVPNYNAFLPSVGRKLGLIKKALRASSNRAQEASLSLVAQKDLLQSSPRLTSKNQNCELWVKEEEFDLSFRSKTMASFEVISKKIQGAPLHTMHLEILSQLLAAFISPILYPSEKIGYTYEISPSSKGDVRLGFTISGFPEGVYAIIKLITSNLKDMVATRRISPAMFRQARVAVRSKYENAASENCTALATVGLLIVLEECMWPVEDRLDALEEIDIETFKSFCSSFLTMPTYLNLFVQGDLSYADAINDLLISEFAAQNQSQEEATVREPVAHVLEPGTNVYIKRHGSREDPNNSIVYFIQTGDRDDMRIFTLTSLTEFLMSTTLVPDLRTKKQIGYAVFGGLRLLTTTVGIHVTCMSGSPPEHLEFQINEYLSFMEKEIIGTMSEEDFQSNLKKFKGITQRGPANKLQKTAGPADVMAQIEANVRSGNIGEQGAPMLQHKRIKHQISSRRYNFDVEDEPIDENLLKTLTLRQYRTFFDQHISIYSKTRSKISIMVESAMSFDDISNKRLFLQVESYLKLKGLKISTVDLKKIIEASQGKPQSLLKELLKYFAYKGDAFKICNLALKEIFRVIMTTVKLNSTNTPSETTVAMNRKVACALPLIRIEDVNEYRLRK